MCVHANAYLCIMTDREHVKLTIYNADTESSLTLPYADAGIRAGFPSPAQDYIDSGDGLYIQ